MRTFTVLVNPISGGGQAPERVEPVAALLREAGATVTEVLTEGPGHATEVAREAASAGLVVVAAGGDGLVRDAADGVVPADGLMGIIPAGRGNDLARRLGWPSDPAGLAALLLDGEPRAVDLLQCNGVQIPGNLYAGLDSAANAMINSSRWIPAPVLYRLAPILTMLRWRPVIYRLTIDGTVTEVPGHTVVVANTGGYGHGLDIVPSAVCDDGVFDVLIAGDMPKWKIARLMREAEAGTHVEHPEMTVVRACEITIDADRNLPVYADGDFLCDLPVTVRLRKGGLRLLRP
jgi:YegS/Rv2252/BmrU family lipid kinase